MLWVITLDEYKSLTIHKPHFRSNQMIQQYHALRLVWYRGCNSFTISSLNIDLPIWTKDFELWFLSLKDFILQPYCPVFVRLGPLEPFENCFVSSAVVSWQQFCNIGQFHSLLFTLDVNKYFSRHWFSCAEMFGAAGPPWRKLVTLIKLSSALVALSLPVQLLVCLSRFLMSPNSIIHCSSGN